MPNATELIKKRYGNVVQGPQGFAMPEKTARRIEEASKVLPRDFTYRRHGYNAKQARTDVSERTEVSIITSDAVDRDRECVLPAGGDWGAYNRVVPFCHKYDELPAGFNQWIKPVGRTLEGKTQYPVKPADWGDAPWMPSAIWHMLTQDVPTLGAKSIGFLPLNVRQATPSEKSARPELDGIPIIDKWLGLEYSCVVIPANPESEIVAVSKALKEGKIDARIAEVIMKSVPTLPTQPNPRFASVHVRPPPAIANAAMKMAKSMPRTSLSAGGRTDDPCIKIATNLRTSDPQAVANCLNGEGPLKCVMGKSAHEPMGDKDHVHIPIDSDDLKRLAVKMKSLPHGLTDIDKPGEFSKGLTDIDKPGEFSPKMTLGFTHSGKGQNFAGMDDLDGVSFKSSKLTFADPDGNETDIALTGGEAKVIGHRKAFDMVNAKSGGRLAHLDFTAPADCRKCMQKGLDQHAGYSSMLGGHGSAGMGGADCATPEQLSMASHLMIGGRASPMMVRSIKAWHDGPGVKASAEPDGSPGHTLDLLHGQIHGKAWAKRLCKDMDDLGEDGGEALSLANPQESTPTPTEPVITGAPVDPAMNQSVVHKPGGKTASESGNAGSVVPDSMPNCPDCGTNDGVTKMATADGAEPMMQCEYCGKQFAPPKPAVKAVKGIEVNQAGYDNAMDLIGKGEIDGGPWAFTAADRAKAADADYLATDGSIDPSAEAHWKYPVIKGGKVYKKGVSAAQGRATGNNATSVAEAAGRLSDAIGKKLDAAAKSLAVQKALDEPFVTAAELKAAGELELAAQKAAMSEIFEAEFSELLAKARGSTD